MKIPKKSRIIYWKITVSIIIIVFLGISVYLYSNWKALQSYDRYFPQVSNFLRRDKESIERILGKQVEVDKGARMDDHRPLYDYGVIQSDIVITIPGYDKKLVLPTELHLLNHITFMVKVKDIPPKWNLKNAFRANGLRYKYDSMLNELTIFYNSDKSRHDDMYWTYIF